MKYELLALVNSLAREERANGSDELYREFENLYDDLCQLRDDEITPIDVGVKIFDVYFEFMNDNYDFRKEQPKIEGKENNKSFFLDHDKVIEELDRLEAKKYAFRGYELFLDELCDMLGIIPIGLECTTEGKMNLIKKEIEKLNYIVKNKKG